MIASLPAPKCSDSVYAWVNIKISREAAVGATSCCDAGGRVRPRRLHPCYTPQDDGSLATATINLETRLTAHITSRSIPTSASDYVARTQSLPGIVSLTMRRHTRSTATPSPPAYVTTFVTTFGRTVPFSRSNFPINPASPGAFLPGFMLPESDRGKAYNKWARSYVRVKAE